MEHDASTQDRITQAFEEFGIALIEILSASSKIDWQLRHRAAETFAKAATGVYRALREDEPAHR